MGIKKTGVRSTVIKILPTAYLKVVYTHSFWLCFTCPITRRSLPASNLPEISTNGPSTPAYPGEKGWYLANSSMFFYFSFLSISTHT